MNAKTYRASTIQEALDKIKKEFGHDAVILSTQPVLTRRSFGLSKAQNWEITAKPAVKPVAETPKPTTPVTPRLQQNDSRIEELLEEVNELKRSVKLIGKALPSHAGESRGVYAELLAQGVDPGMADHLVTEVRQGNPSPAELRDRVRHLLAEMLIVDSPLELKGKTRTVSVFIGPTGAGKTTTIAKLAGHAKVRFGKRVALISTDLLRVGAYEQLARYGDLLGIPTYSCGDLSALKDLIQSLDDREVILIDTPGSAAADDARMSKLETITSTGEARVHLVIAASTRSEDISNIIRKFHRFSPRRVVITKIDETDPKGAFVSDILRNEMPISYLTNGQRVPEDLMIPSADDLSRYLLPGETVTTNQISEIARSL